MPAELRRGRPDGQVVGGARPGTDFHGDLLDAMTIEPVLRRQYESSAGDQADLDVDTELPVRPSRRGVVDQSTNSHKVPSRPVQINCDSSWAARATGNRPLTNEATYFVQRFNIRTPQKESDVAARCSSHPALQGRGLYSDGPKQTASLPGPVALRNNRQGKSGIIRGLPSRTVQTFNRVRPQSTVQCSQLPEVSVIASLQNCILYYATG